MTALSAGKTAITPSKWTRKQFTLTSGQKAWHGGLASLVIGTGKLVVAGSAMPSSGVNMCPIGKFAESVDASATGLNADSPATVEFDKEKTLSTFVNGTSGDIVAAADIGKVVYMLDDQTATIVSNASPLGIFWGFDGSSRCLVELFTVAGNPGIGAIKGATLAFASNDCVITAAQALSDAAFDVPTTGAASTITLPVTGVADGTTLKFVADGTKNGHTVTYRFGTTAISAALTASKIHCVIAVKMNSGWGQTTTVSP